MVGAMLWAEHIANGRYVVEFLKSMSKGASKTSGRRGGITRRRR